MEREVAALLSYRSWTRNLLASSRRVVLRSALCALATWAWSLTSMKGGRAFDVEFVAGDGRTVAVLTLESRDVCAVTGAEILHVRAISWPSSSGGPLPRASRPA